jgi:hypothetical protein
MIWVKAGHALRPPFRDEGHRVIELMRSAAQGIAAYSIWVRFIQTSGTVDYSMPKEDVGESSLFQVTLMLLDSSYFNSGRELVHA